jgi:hypothetical protein
MQHKLRQIIEVMIADDLTIGRTDNGRESFTVVQIAEFILNNDDNICKLIETIMREYADDINDTPNYEFEYSQIREYFYDDIDTSVHNA